MDDLEFLREFRSHVPAPSAGRIGRARTTLLAETEARPARPRPLLRRPAALALIATPATAVIAFAALVFAGSLGGSEPSLAAAAIIHRADEALSMPPHQILHTEVVGDGFGAETWQLTSPPYSALGMKGPLGHEQESASTATTASFYDPATNTIHESAATKQRSGAVGDPLETVRADLADGSARLLGSTVTDGTPTYKIEFAENGGFGAGSLIAYVDRRTYRPILLSDPQRNGGVVQLKIVTFQYLPATPANLRLLTLAARHPGARVVIDQSSQSSGAEK
jgi:hypothetical protein